MKRILALLLLVVAFAFLGCVDADKIAIRFDLQKDLSGTLSLEFLGIQSSKDGVENQKKEMAEFYETSYHEDAARISEEWGMRNVNTVLTNKTDLHCDGKISGDFGNLVRSLAPLLDEREATYKIDRDGNRFAFTVGGIANNEKNDIVLSIHYPGTILENNAQKYDRDQHTMEWNFQKLDDSGIHFVLETPISR